RDRGVQRLHALGSNALRLRQLCLQRGGAGSDPRADLDAAAFAGDRHCHLLRRGGGRAHHRTAQAEADLPGGRGSARRGGRLLGEAVSPLESASVLLVLLLVLLAGGVWIAISLAAVAWFGLHFFTSTPPDVNLFQSFWGSSASWTLAALPLFVWMGEILYRTKLSEEMFEGLSPWLGWLPGRLMHVNILGCAV